MKNQLSAHHEFAAQEKLICEQEERVRSEIKKLQELHQFRKKEPVENYVFQGWDGKITLAELFGGKNELILIHNMGKQCNYCTLWADGFQGFYKHLKTRAGFVLANHNSPAEQKEFAKSRGWEFPMVSAAGTSFAKDMGFLSDDGSLMNPGVSIFQKNEAGEIFRTTSAGFGPGDLFAGIWHLFDLLPGGPGNWQPK